MDSRRTNQFLSGGGEMGALIREKDWSKTVIGAPETWPQSLRTMVSVMLDNPFGMYIAWGKEYIQLYNDGYRPILGSTKHPQALGISTRETFSEIWHIIGSMFDDVMKGNAVGFPDFMLPLNRNGFVEECYFDFSYSPIRKEDGEVGGVLVTVVETTENKKIQQQLKESKDVYEFAIDASDIGTWDIDLDKGRFTGNERLKEWHGLLQGDEFDLESGFDAVIEKDRESVKKAIERSLEFSTGGLLDVEYTIINPLTKQARIVRAKGKATFGVDKKAYRLNGTLQDVTQQISARKAIEESEKNLRLMITQAPVAMCVFKGKNHVVEIVNDLMLELWGRGKQQVINKPIFEGLPEAKGQGLEQIIDEVFTTGEKFEANERPVNLPRNNRIETIYINFVYEPLKDAGGNIYGIIAIANDVTPQVVARKKIEESEEQLRIALEGGELGTFDFYPETEKLIWSEKTKQLFGLPPGAEVNYQVYLQALHPEDRQNSRAIARQQIHLKSGGLYELEYRAIGITDGKLRWLRSKGKVAYNAAGNPVRYTGVIYDITGQKEAEEAVKDTEQRLRSLIDSAPFPIGVYTGSEMRIAFVNDSILDAWGRKGDVAGKLYADILPELTGQGIYEQLDAVFTTGIPFHAKNKAIGIVVDGKLQTYYFNYSFTPLHDAAGNIYGVLNTAANVTDLNVATRKIQESEKEFRQLADSLPALVWTTDNKGVQTFASKRWKEYTGFDPYDETTFEKMMHPDDLQNLLDIWAECLATGNIYKANVRLKSEKGDYQWFYVNGEPVKNEQGEIEKWIGTFTNINEQKKIEEILRTTLHKVEESEERLRMAIQLTHLGTWEFNPLSGELNWSEECKKIYALPEDATVDFKVFSDHIHPDDRGYVEKAIQNSMIATGDGTYDIIYRILRFNDNSERWIKAGGKVYFTPEQQAERFIGTVIDITDQKLSQQQLAESEQRSRLAIEAAEMGTFNWDLVTNDFISSQRLNDIFGFPGQANITHQHLLDVFHPEDKSIRDKAVKEAAEKGSLSYEARVIWPDKTVHWVRVYGKIMYNEQQQPLKMYGTAVDITVEKANITALEESTSRLNIAIEAAELGMWELDINTRKMFYSESYLHLFGFDKNEQPGHEELLNKLHPDDQSLSTVAEKLALEKGFLDIELRILPNPGSIRWIKTKGKVFYDRDGLPEKMLGTIMDITEEKHFQQELIEREQKFRLLADSMPQFVWTGNAAGELNYFNRSVYDYCGLSPEQISKDGWLQIVHPDDREENIKRWTDAVKNGTNFLLEHRFRRSDGEYRWQLSRAIPQKSADGNIQMWVGTSTDIQDQKLWSEKIQKSELLFKTISNVSPVGLWMTDTNAQNTFVNDTWIAWTGVPLEKQLGVGWLSRVVEEDKRDAPAKFWDCMQKREKYVTEFRIIKPDGQLQWCLTEGSPYSDIHGNFAGYAGSVTDITERKLVEKELERKVAERTLELRKSEERNFRMVNEVQEYAILLLSREGIIENWNKGAERIKGYTEEEAVGKHFRMFYTKEDQEKNVPERFVEKATNAGRAVDEGWRVKKDGTVFWASIVITALHDDANNIIGYSKVTRDLTERKKAEEKLRETNVALEKANEELGKSNTELEQFAYVASHDLQEPLRKIRFFTERLEHSMVNADDSSKEYYQKIQKATDRMNTLIKDLLDFSRLSNNDQLFIKTDLNVVVDNVRNDLELLIQQKDAVVEMTHLPVIEAIPLQMQQLFYNLVSNSLKFSQKDITPVIKITAAALPADELKLHNLDESLSYYQIEVKDNGIGFEQEYAEQIFVIFQRLNDLYSYGGTGIGLALCRKIVLNHHGKIYATGKEGEGAAFYIILPLAQKKDR